MKTPALLIFVSLITACGGFASEKPVDNFIPVNCNPIPWPSPVELPELAGITNETTHWELTHSDFSALVAWMHEFERYLEDNRHAWRYVLDCLDDYNQRQEIVPEEKKAGWLDWIN